MPHGQLRGEAQDEVSNVAASGSMSFPSRKPWSQEDSGRCHNLIPNSGGQFPRPQALGRGLKRIGENVHDYKPCLNKWIIYRRGNIKGKEKQFFTLAQVMGRETPKHRWRSKMCLESRGVAANFRMSVPPSHLASRTASTWLLSALIGIRLSLSSQGALDLYILSLYPQKPAYK